MIPADVLKSWHPENWDHTTIAWLKRPEGKSTLWLLQAVPAMFAALKMIEDDPGLTSAANMVVKSALSEALTGGEK